METPQKKTHYITSLWSNLMIAVAVVISWRVVMWLVGATADQFLPYQPSFPYAAEKLAISGWPRWAFSWANFDGVHYLTIAEMGYVGTGLIQAFFPLYPGLIAGISKLLIFVTPSARLILASQITSSLAFVGLCTVWLGWREEVSNRSSAIRSLIALLVFPTAFYWAASYGESLFLLLVVGSWWSAGRRHWGRAGTLALLAAATRLVGVFLVPALIVEYLYQNRVELQKKRLTFFQNRAHLISLLKISVGTLGLFGYMAYLWWEFGDPLYFRTVQSEFGSGRQESLILYPQVLWRSIKILLTFPLHNIRYFSYLQQFLAGTLPLAAILWYWRKIGVGLSLFSLACFFLPTTTGNFSSMPRYIMVMLPLYILLADQFSGKKWWLWLTLSTIWLMINTVLFIQGYWVA